MWYHQEILYRKSHISLTIRTVYISMMPALTATLEAPGLSAWVASSVVIDELDLYKLQRAPPLVMDMGL